MALIRKYLVGLICGVLLCTAATPASGDDNSTSYQDLFARSLQEASDIASRTKLNIYDMPAFVSILRQDELLKLGVDTVYDALILVPGVEPYIEASGAKPLIFRGVKEKSKVKLMVDGITVNNTYRGSIYFYLDFPIELVERIEVIRGPGSVLYGSGAITGVINIVTKSSERYNRPRAFASAGSSDTYKGGMFYSGSIKGFHVALDGYYTEGHRDIAAGPDKSGMHGQTDESVEDYSLGLVAEDNHWKLTARLKDSQNGLAFGAGNYLERLDDQDGRQDRTLLTELEYQDEISASLNWVARLGYKYYAQALDARHTPLPDGDLIYTYDWVESSIYGDCSLKTTFLDDHDLVLGLRYERAEKKKNDLDAYFDRDPDLSFVSSHLMPNLNAPRRIFSLYASDQFNFSENLTFSGDLRWDDYSDFGDTLSPRFAMVYRYSDQLNCKFILSRSYRAPSWVEMYGEAPGISVSNEELDEEIADTVEAGFVYRQGMRSLFRLNFYYSRIDQLIYRDLATRQYRQQENTDEHLGAELELRYSLGDFTDLYLQAGYIYAEAQDSQKLDDFACLTGNVRLMHTFSSGLTSATVYRYVTDRGREEGDDRDDLSGYNVVDQILTYDFQDFRIIGGVKNVFDYSVIYPAAAGTYPDDYPREGRTFILKISRDF